MKMRIFLASLLSLSAMASAEFTPSLQLDKRLRYETQQVTAKSAWGQSSDMLLIPAFTWGRQALLPVLVQLEEGRGVEIEETFFVRRTTYMGKPVYRVQLDADTAFKLWGSGKRTINAEKDDTVPFKGLYDYEEFGVGTGLDKKLGSALGFAGMGVELQHRHYPNWRLPGPSLTWNRNEYTKDYDGLKADLELKGRKDSNLPWRANVTWLGKMFGDSYLFDQASNGQVLGSVTVPDNRRRLDSLLRVGLDGAYGLGSGWSLSANLGLDWNASNMNEFDFNPQYLVGFSDFYGYHATSGGLGLTWAPAKDSAVVALRASLSNRVYTGRPIRNSNGDYTMGYQADVEQDYRLDAEQPIGAGFSLVAGMDYLVVISNQAFAGQVRTTYDLFTGTMGLKYKL